MGEYDYDFELEKILREIEKTNARIVGLQFPEGLKEYAVIIAAEIEDRTNAKVIIFTDPTYGACDTKDDEAKKLKIDLLIHFGHTKL